MQRTWFPLIPLQAGLLLGALVGLPTSGLSAQLVELHVPVEEGAGFVRTSRQVQEVSGPGTSSTTELRWTVGIRVAELRGDGSGTLHFTVDSLVTEDAGMMDSLAATWLGTTMHVPFESGGTLDLSGWSNPDLDDERAFLEALRFAETLGPLGHAAGLPRGIPPALRVGESFRSPRGARIPSPSTSPSRRLKKPTDDESLASGSSPVGPTAMAAPTTRPGI